MRQSPVSKSRAPLRIWNSWGSQIVTEAFLNVTVYPLLHSFPTESQEWLAIPWKTCTMDAAAFSSGMSNAAVWDDSIVAPLGSRTVNGF
jgi:hypothetical protein